MNISLTQGDFMVKKSRVLPAHYMKEGEELEIKKAPDSGIRVKGPSKKNKMIGKHGIKRAK